MSGGDATGAGFGFGGLVLDVDGVLVDSPHEHAWREALRELLEGAWHDVASRTSWTPGAFTAQVYQREMSGRPRLDGARAALEHFGVPDVDQRVDVYAQRKQAMLVELVDAGRFDAYPDALRFVLAARRLGLSLCAASSSKNAWRFLRRISAHGDGRPSARELDPGESLLEALDADVSGRNVARGKPHADLFLEAIGELGLEPARCVVVEDAAAGIAAAVAGGMAALAISRADDAPALADAGADLVVTSLDDVDVEALGAGRLVARGA